MTVRQGSIARAAFDDARRALAERSLSSARQAPAIDLVLPACAAPASSAEPVGGVVARGPITAAAAALEEGRTTSRQLLEDALAAIDERDAELCGVAAIDVETARAAAGALDAEAAQGRRRGPLHGIPLSVKDVIDVAGLPTCAGSLAYLDRPERDAEGVARLRQAGALLHAKATTHEFALGVTSPQSRNPHDPTRLAGGSSGGSAVTVATGMALGSLGTDTRASIRVPAALCGLVGFKPTYGRVPTGGVVTLSWTMDHVAPMARTVADASLLLDALAPSSRPWLEHASAIDLRDLRIGLAATPFAEATEPVATAVSGALGALEEVGSRLSSAPRPDGADLDLASAAGMVVSRCEAATQHLSLGLDRDLYWQEVAEQLEEATRIPAVEYLEAQRLRRDLSEGLLQAFRDHDVLAMPTVGIVAPPAEDFAAHLVTLARNAIPWSFVGFPAVTVPAGTVEGLPVGLQLVAPPGREDLLLATAGAVERAAG